jgi:hypothetical protein
MLGYLGTQPTGTVKKNDEVWCIFNYWEASYRRPEIEGIYENGRFSIGTTFGGKWYCCKKSLSP